MNNTATNTAPCPTVRKQIGKTTYIVRVHFSQTANNTQPCFRKTIDKTTYVVRVHFSETSKETMQDKIKRLLREEVRKM